MLAILEERPGGRGVGVDCSEPALAVARENAALLKLSDRAEFRLADWARGLPSDHFDLVVANPPYVRTGDIAGLDAEVRDHEPRLAIDGGPDGLDAHRGLAPQILRVLREAGVFAVEIGPEQGDEVQALFLGAGAGAVRIVADIAGRPRVVTGIKKALGKEPASG
jgi:release factor glutamine methyltransferase